MNEFLRGMRRRRIICARRINLKTDIWEYEFHTLPITFLAQRNYGPKMAWVPDDRGGWPGRPGYIKLFYKKAVPNGYQWRADYNARATKMLHAEGVSHITPLPRWSSRSKMHVLGYAWLALDPGALRNYFKLKIEHYEEVNDYIREEFDGFGFDMYSERDKLLVFPMFKTPECWAAWKQKDCVGDRVKARDFDFEDEKLKYEIFPMHAKMTWG